MKRIFVTGLLVALMALPAIVGAQTLTGTISGKVVDEQGGVLPGVTVTLTGATGTQVQVSDAKGEYRFIGLAPGTYSVKAELQGFRPKEQMNLNVSIGSNVEAPLTMTVGGLTETVDVIANAITVDTTSTKTDTSMSQDMLFSMPLSHNNPAVSILQYAPGVNDGSAFGGASDGANSLMLDGVDTRDPEGGTAWAFYNYNIIDQVQVGSLGQPAEYGGFTGAVVNTITKSGGNRFSFLSEYRFTSDSLGSNNLTSDILDKNPSIYPAQIINYRDYTVQLGGPIEKDKLFFFGSVQRYHIDQHLSRPLRTEISPRFNVKFTWQPTPSDNIVGSLQYDNYNQKGRTGGIPGYAVLDNSQTLSQDSPEYIYNAQYRKIFNSSTFLEAKYTGWWGYYYLNPVIQAPTQDVVTGFADGSPSTDQYFGGAGYNYLADRTRNQVNVSLSKYAQMAGSHNFKFGAEIERSTVRDRFAYTQGPTGPAGYFFTYNYVDNGDPTNSYSYTYAYNYSYDLKGRNKRESFYAQDQWKVGNNLTLNLGLRADHIVGQDQTTGKDLYKTFSFGPRLGAAYDLTGKGTSVIRGFYGQMYDSAMFSSWSRAAQGLSPYETWYTDDTTPWEETTSTSTYTVGNNLKHPRVDEFNVAFEQQIAGAWKVTATGIYRSYKNFVNSVLADAQWSSVRYTPSAWEGPGSSPIAGTPITIYQWDNATDTPHFNIQNTDQVTYQIDGNPVTVDAYRKYKGLMLILERPFKNRWSARVSYVLSKTTGTVGNSTYAGISSGQFETPNTILTNADGPTQYDRRNELKIFAGYQIPKAEVSVNGFWHYLSGWPYNAIARLGAGNFNWTGAIYVNLDAPGSHMTPSENALDLRFEKVFNYGIHRFGVYADVQNVFNQATILSEQARYQSRSFGYFDPATQAVKSADVWFGSPLTVSAGRQVTLGLRWSF